MIEASRYLLDTTVLVDSSKGREPARSWVGSVTRSTADISVSTVTIAEFFAGTLPGERGRAERLFDEPIAWPVTTEIAIRAGVYRYDYARRGRTILTPDALIAATAVVAGAVLVTTNVKDFPMPEVQLLRLGA